MFYITTGLSSLLIKSRRWWNC